MVSLEAIYSRNCPLANVQCHVIAIIDLTLHKGTETNACTVYDILLCSYTISRDIAGYHSSLLVYPCTGTYVPAVWDADGRTSEAQIE